MELSNPTWPLLDSHKLGSLLLDLQHAGFLLDFVTGEVSYLGHFMPLTITKLSNVYICHLPKSTIRSILQQAARAAVSRM